MASSTEEHTVPESQNEIQASTCSCEPTTKSACEHCRNMCASGPESWPYGAWHCVRTALEIQAVVRVA